MGKLIYKHGTMHSSKTAQLLMAAHNYSIQGKKVIGIKPDTDSRGAYGFIQSRTPLNELLCLMISQDDNIDDVLEGFRLNEYACILIDEAQFLTAKQVKGLHEISTVFDIDIIAYGLKNSYRPGVIFEGSIALLYYADSIEEIKTVCQYCNSKATQNLRLIDDEPVYSGDTVKVGDVTGDEKYVPVCNYHYSLGGVL